MTQWLRDQTELQRLLDLNRELREEIAAWSKLNGRNVDELEALRQENALLEADNAKMMSNLAYDPKDNW